MSSSHFLLQIDLFLLSLVELHDLDSLLLHEATFLDVKLLLRLQTCIEPAQLIS